MRTPEEILARIEAVKNDDFFGAQRGRLIEVLPFEQGKPFYKDEYVTKVESGEETFKHIEPTREYVVEQIADYMPFAWEKANNCRGLSAGRSIDHMRALVWLLEDDELVESCDRDYEHYGKPILVKICEKLGLDWKQWDNGFRGNSESDQHSMNDL